MAGDRRWLILSYFSQIDGMACAQHIDDRLAHLEGRGITPILLTGICGGRRPGVVHARVPSLAPSGLRFEIRHLFRKSRLPRVPSKILETLLLLPIYPFYLLEKVCIDLDSQWSWFPLAAIRGSSLCGRHRPEIVYSTGGAASAHIAAALVARRRGLPWIAEVQDPLVHDDWQRSRRALAAYRWAERTICRGADAVVFVTDAARRSADLRTGLGDRGRAVYPGADGEEVPGAAYAKGPFCRFAHFGSLGGSRNLGTVIAALGLLFRERPGLAAVVRLDVYGTWDRASRALADTFPYPGVIVDHGRVPRGESLAAMRRADVLLLIQNTEAFSADTIPSKTYEYFRSGRPVLGLVHRNAELASMFASLGHAAADAADPEAVKKALGGYLEKWEREGLPPSAVPSPYTVASAVGRLVSIAEEVLSRRKGRPGGAS